MDLIFEEAFKLVEAENHAAPPLSLRGFINEFWHILEPATRFEGNWHIDAICDHLVAMTHKQITRLVINVPPGHMKSLLCCVFWTPWAWSEIDASTRWLFSSYDATLSTRDSLKSRRIIQSYEYQSRYKDRFTLSGDQNLKTYFENSRTGFRMSTSVKGSGTGNRANFIVCDDPHKVTEAESDAVREGAVNWWSTEMSNRGSAKDSGYLVIQQRVHYLDVAGWCKEHGYEYLVLPSEFEGQQSYTFLNFQDPRKEDGELLWPERFPQSTLDEQKESLGSYGYAGQHQQRPVPREGGMAKLSWFNFYQELPQVFDQIVLSIDSAYKPKQINDPWSVQVWGMIKNRYYLIHRYRKRCLYPEGKRLVINSVAEFQANTALIEDKSSGQALIPDLREEIPTIKIIPIEPEADKVTRFSTVTPIIEAGRVWLPDPKLKPWVNDYLLEILTFPLGVHDDDVDGTSQFLRWASQKRTNVIQISNYVRRVK